MAERVVVAMRLAVVRDDVGVDRLGRERVRTRMAAPPERRQSGRERRASRVRLARRAPARPPNARAGCAHPRACAWSRRAARTARRMTSSATSGFSERRRRNIDAAIFSTRTSPFARTVIVRGPFISTPISPINAFVPDGADQELALAGGAEHVHRAVENQIGAVRGLADAHQRLAGRERQRTAGERQELEPRRVELAEHRHARELGRFLVDTHVCSASGSVRFPHRHKRGARVANRIRQRPPAGKPDPGEGGRWLCCVNGIGFILHAPLTVAMRSGTFRTDIAHRRAASRRK